jgi:hypothetical protein
VEISADIQQARQQQIHGCTLHLNDDIAEANDLAQSRPAKLQALSDMFEQWESEMSKTAISFVAAPRKKK